MTGTETVLEARGLRKVYGDRAVVDGVSLAVRAGEVYGLLGPNGAGKTTTVRMLVTLLAPDSGTATIAGHDIGSAGDAVRAAIGYVPQELIADRTLTARENALYCARLQHLRGAERAERIERALRLVGLWDERDKRVRTFSGGMRKKLDLACGLLHEPSLLVLDEPSLGLDVATRRALWEHIEALRDGGMAVVLCTNAMEEADRLATRVGIIDRGTLVSEDTPEALKRSVGGEVVVLTPETDGALDALEPAISGLADVQGTARAGGDLHVTVEAGPAALPGLVEAAGAAGVGLRRVGYHGPTLEDAFLAITGRTYDAAGDEQPRKTRGRR